MLIYLLATILGVAGIDAAKLERCTESITTASGTFASEGPFCSGDLIFEDNFDFFDLKRWQHENNMAGGGNGEFQWYVNNRSNSFVEDGLLHIRPTLTSDFMGEVEMFTETIDAFGGGITEQCTNWQFNGCQRTGTKDSVINPLRSARVRSVESFSFRYGKIEVNAKMPSGDWIWPAIWMMPRDNAYGTWPASGEIDLAEVRGNLDLKNGGNQIGVSQAGQTLHFGPFPELNAYPTAHFTTNKPLGGGFNTAFHRYQMEWTPEKIVFTIDDLLLGTVDAGNGFWQRGGFDANAPGLENPWRHATPMAPFDQEFYLIMNIAVGGTGGYFPDGVENPGGKPWYNDAPFAMTDFWKGRNKWLPTWNLETNNGRDASLLVDYVKIWAL